MVERLKLTPLKEFVVEDAATTLLRASGDDVTREGLRDTPSRFAKAFSFLTSGYNRSAADVITKFDASHDELVFQGNITVWSLCEHHLLPFFGVAHIGYIPNGKSIIGLSKFARIVDVFARRLQVQERLTAQIADALVEHLTPQGVGVVLQCRHACMEARGIRQSGTVTMTSALRGCIKDEPEARAEFMSLVHATR